MKTTVVSLWSFIFFAKKREMIGLGQLQLSPKAQTFEPSGLGTFVTPRHPHCNVQYHLIILSKTEGYTDSSNMI